MKIKNRTIVLISILVLIISFILILNPEPHFKITKEGVEVNKIECGEYVVKVWNQIK